MLHLHDRKCRGKDYRDVYKKKRGGKWKEKNGRGRVLHFICKLNPSNTGEIEKENSTIFLPSLSLDNAFLFLSLPFPSLIKCYPKNWYPLECMKGEHYLRQLKSVAAPKYCTSIHHDQVIMYFLFSNRLKFMLLLQLKNQLQSKLGQLIFACIRIISKIIRTAKCPTSVTKLLLPLATLGTHTTASAMITGFQVWLYCVLQLTQYLTRRLDTWPLSQIFLEFLRNKVTHIL